MPERLKAEQKSGIQRKILGSSLSLNSFCEAFDSITMFSGADVLEWNKRHQYIAEANANLAFLKNPQ